MTPTTGQLAALVRLWNMAQRDHGGARVCARLLLGLYNGDRFQFDLTDLRLLDNGVLRDAFDVLIMDSAPMYEVHEHLNILAGRRDFGMRFEHLAHTWRVKGRCRNDCLLPLQPQRLPDLVPPQALAAAPVPAPRGYAPLGEQVPL